MPISRRDDKSIRALVLNVANAHQTIRAVILNGSRASATVKQDDFQDFDIICVVTEVEPFVADRNWIQQFGDILIMQTPDEIDGNWPGKKDKFTFLMLFSDTNRIDLTFMTQEAYFNTHRDSQSVILLDKDNQLDTFDSPSDIDYLPKPPSKKQFQDCCNEFWWVSTYVVKGICRKQLTYAKHTAEIICKQQLIKLLCWYAAMKTNHAKSMGMFAKNIEQFVEADVWDKFKKTYVDSAFDNIWKGLFNMCMLFDEIAIAVAANFNFEYSESESRNVFAYLKEMRERYSD